MYGLINASLKHYVVLKKGIDFWDDINNRHQLKAEFFRPMARVEDEFTFNLVAIVCEEMQIDSRNLLVEFGKHWILTTANESFSLIMKNSGADLITFMHNINDLHDQISTTFLNYTPPRFSVEKVEDGLYDFYYSSHRIGLTSFVEGLILGMAEQFDTDIVIEDIQLDRTKPGENTALRFRILS